MSAREQVHRAANKTGEAALKPRALAKAPDVQRAAAPPAVMRRCDSSVQRQAASQMQRSHGNAAVARDAAAQRGETDAQPMGVREAFTLATSGRPSAVPFKSEMEQALGADFGGVQAYLGGPQAQQGLRALQAEAATYGEQIAFRSGSPAKELVAHELTHVVQQRGVSGKPSAGGDGPRTTSKPSDASEQEASQAGRDVAAGRTSGGEGAASGAGASDTAARAAGGASVARAAAPPVPIPTQIDNLLAAPPYKPGALYKLITSRKFTAAQRQTMGQDAAKMKKIAAVMAASRNSMSRVVVRLQCNLNQSIRWTCEANQSRALGWQRFRRRFVQATAAELLRLLQSPARLKELRNATSKLHPLIVKAIKDNPAQLMAVLKSRAGRQWVLSKAGNPARLVRQFKRAQRNALKSDHAAIDGLLQDPSAASCDLINLLRRLGFSPVQMVPKVHLAKADVRLGIKPFPYWFRVKTTKTELDGFVSSPHLQTLKAGAGAAVNPLKIRSLRKRPGDFGALLGTKPEFKQWIVEVQTWPALLRYLARRLNAAMYAALKAGGQWATLQRDLDRQRQSGDRKNAKKAIAKFKKVMPAGDVEAFQRIFEASDRQAAAKAALKRAGRILVGLPAQAPPGPKPTTPQEKLDALLKKPNPSSHQVYWAVRRLPTAQRKALASDAAKMTRIVTIMGASGRNVLPLALRMDASLEQIVSWLQKAGQAWRMTGKSFRWRVHGRVTRAELERFVDTPQLTALKSAAGKSVRPLSIRKVYRNKADFGAVLGAKANYRSWINEIEGANSLLSFLAHRLSTVMYTNLKAGGQWDALLKEIQAQREGGAQATARKVIDRLFKLAPDGDMAILKRLFKMRFGISAGTAAMSTAAAGTTAKNRMQEDGVHEANFDAKGLRRIYDSYKRLPPGQVESGKLKVMTRHVTYEKVCPHAACARDNKPNPAGGNYANWGPNCRYCHRPLKKDANSTWGGFAFNSHPHLSVDYDQANDAKKAESGESTDKTTDAKRGKQMLDTLVLHEMGHKVDAGRRYSDKDPTFLRLAHWKAYKLGSVALSKPLRLALEGGMGNPYGAPADLTAAERQLARDGIDNAFAGSPRPKKEADLRKHLRKAYVDRYGVTTAVAKGAGTRRKLSELWAHLKGQNLYRHVWKGSSAQSPWYNGEPFAVLNQGRQFHEGYGYAQKWWSYKTKYIQQRKISQYQFRCPADHFAELYAVYWSTTKPGSALDRRHVRWFKSKRLHLQG